MSASNDVRAAIFETLPRGLQGLLSSPTYVNFADCPVPNTKDAAIIAQGILSANLNALFKSIFDQVSIAELMMYSGSSNPCHLGILLSSLSLGNSNYEMNATPTVIPQYEDVDGVPTVTGGTLSIPVTFSGSSPNGESNAPEELTVYVPSLLDAPEVVNGLSSGQDLIEILLTEAQMGLLRNSNIAGWLKAVYKDGVTRMFDFIVEATGLGE